MDVEPGAVEGAVRGDRGEHLADGSDSALARGLRTLHDQGGRAHAHDHAVASAVEGQGRILHPLVGGRRARSQEAGADPLHQEVGGGVVGGDDDHAATAPGPDPVLGQAHRLGRARAGRVHLGVGSAGADVLGELRVAHGEDAEQEATIEDEAVLAQQGFRLLDPTVELGEGRGRRPASVESRPQVPQQGELLPATAVLVVARHVLGEGVEAGEGGSEDDPGVVAQRVGKGPAVGQRRPAGRRLVAHHERDARVAQGLEARPDREPGHDVEGGDPLGGDAELLLQVEGPRPAGQLDDVGDVVDGLEARLAHLALDQAHDVLVRHAAPHVASARAPMSCSPRRRRPAFESSKTRGRPGRPRPQPVMTTGSSDLGSGAGSAAVEREAALQELGEQAAQLLMAIRVQGRGRHRRRARGDRPRCDRARRCRRCARRPAAPQPLRVVAPRPSPAA